MAAPNSDQTSPSQLAITAPANHPSSACGPPMADRMSGIVMNGPTPTMLSMFEARAGNKVSPRSSLLIRLAGHPQFEGLVAQFVPEDLRGLTATSLKNTTSCEPWF